MNRKTSSFLLTVSILGLLLYGMIQSGSFESRASTPSNTAIARQNRINQSQKNWNPHPANPVIRVGDAIPGIIWNDPSVINDNGIYRMWISGGTGRGESFPVHAYEATSTDGVDWEIDRQPVLEPGTPGSWDEEHVETPMVLKVGDVYHMYYSGCQKGNCERGVFQIGHATSADGTHWTKDPNNPLLSPTEDPFHWGFYTTAEPGVVYNPQDQTFYLYYTTVTVRPGYEGQPDVEVMQGICLMTSADGSHFTHYDADGDGHRDAVLTQSDNYPVTERYNGYSTPFALIDATGTFHLFYDVIQYPNPGDWRQVALAHAVSHDGFSFAEIHPNIFTFGNRNWLNEEVRAPCVLETEDGFKMWFAGHANWFLLSGIGYAFTLPDLVEPPLEGFIVVSDPDLAGNLTIRGAQGTVSENAMVRFFFGVGSLETVTPNSDGSFLLTVSSEVTGGGFDLMVIDGSGNESRLTHIETDRPTIPPSGITISEPEANGRVTISGGPGTVAGESFLHAIFQDNSVTTVVTRSDGSFLLATSTEVVGIGFDLIATDVNGDVLASTPIYTTTIVPSPESVDFGQVFVGSFSSTTLFIGNVTRTAVSIRNITSTLGETLGVSQTAFTIPPGASEEITLTWTPPEKAQVAGTLFIETDVSSATSVRVTGNAIDADVNSDGVMNIFDLTSVATEFGQRIPGSRTDINNDGVVNIFDLTIIGANFGRRTTERG